MKKGIVALPLVLALLLALLCPASLAETYEGEILFRGLPWLSDVNTYSSAIYEDIGKHYDEEDFFYDTLMDLAFTVEETKDVWYYAGDVDVSGPMRLIFSPEGTVGYSYKVSVSDDILVAGYPVGAITGYAIHSVKNGKVLSGEENSQVINAKYSFSLEPDANCDSVYDDLQQKLKLIYGNSYAAWEADTMANSVTEYTGEIEMIRKASVWFGQNDTYILFVRDPGYGNKVYIQYGTLYGAVLVEALSNPESTIDKTSTDGL